MLDWVDDAGSHTVVAERDLTKEVTRRVVMCKSPESLSQFLRSE
jgi:hypothetical protein